MKSLMSFVFLMQMLFTAAPSRADSAAAPEVVNDRSDRYRPVPYPRYCPEGTHRIFDEYAGRYTCVPNDDYEPRPLPWPGGRKENCPKGMHRTDGVCEYIDGPEDGLGGWHADRMKELSGTLGGDDMAAKGAALDGLFDAARSRKSGSGTRNDAVSAPMKNGGASGYYLKSRTGGMKLLHTDPSMPIPSAGTKPGPKILRVECTDSKGCNSPTVQKGVDVIKDAIDLYNKAQNYKRENEENEKKYQEGTKKWNDTHEDHLKRRKEDKNIS